MRWNPKLDVLTSTSRKWFEVSFSSPHAWQRGTSVVIKDLELEDKIKDTSFQASKFQGLRHKVRKSKLNDH